MTSRSKYRIPVPLAIGFIGAGLALAGTDTWASWEFMRQAEGGKITSLVAAVPVAAIAAMLALPGARAAWRLGHRFEALVLIVVLIAASAFSLSTTLDRNGQGRANQLSERQTANLAYTLAKARYDQADEDRKAAEAEIAKQAQTGAGPLWRKAKAEAEAAKQRMKEAEADMKAVGAPRTVDTLAETVMLIFPTLPEAQVVKITPLVQSMFLPLVMYFGGIGFVSVGIGALINREKAARKAERPRAKPKATATTAQVITAPANVVAFPALSRKDQRQWRKAVARLSELRSA